MSFTSRPNSVIYSLVKIKEEALKYKTRQEFKSKSLGFYRAACRHGILDQICTHMPIPNNRPYSEDELFTISLKYNNRSLFAIQDSGAYSAAQERNILDKICAHMGKPGTTSLPELELFDIVKEVYQSAKKLRDRKANISNKSHIKGFDIDIFIPELNKGIEFDGRWHHSFEFMRKDKRKEKWSDEDLRDYDKIKDSYFLSKGIQIIHVKERDWIKNKKECIKYCFKFLKTSISN